MKGRPATQIEAGERFGLLITIEPHGKDRHGRFLWLCQCDCGRKVLRTATRLRTGLRKSCGCLQFAGGRRTHGESNRTKEYSVWKNLKKRCKNPKATGYKNYGGRGIKVCDRWDSSFENFLSDMGRCPEGLSIDRIDNDGDYEPSNCRWTDRSTQLRNQRPRKI